VDARDALEVEALEVRFGQTVVLDHLSFAVARGEVLAIIGPNGSGKTVLFKALIGALPCAGSVRWAKDTRLGYVPQKLDIERDLPLTGDDFLRAKVAVSRAPREERTRVLSLVGFSTELARRPIGALSGGQFQRLLVAAALIGRPTVLLLDEPMAGIDEPGQQSLYETLDRIRADQGLTTLFISHDLSVVYGHATSVLCLARGRACFGEPRRVLTPELLREIYGDVRYHVHDDARS